MNTYEERVIKVLMNLEHENALDIGINMNNINGETPITDMSLNSITFIRLVVELEEEFDIEFEDAMLNFKKISKIKHLCNYIQEMEGNN